MILTFNVILQISKPVLYSIQKSLKQGGDFIFDQVPLECQLGAHLPYDLGVPVFSRESRSLVNAISIAPCFVLVYPIS